MLRAIDISYFQGKMRWDAALEVWHPGRYPRVCDGVWEDPQFQNNAKAPVPLLRQPYLNFYANQLPEVQVDAFTNLAKHYNWHYPPMLDLEPKQDHPDLQARLWHALMLLENRFGGAVLYTNQYKLNKLKLPPRFTRFGLHIARWNAADPGINMPWFPGKLFAWQFKVVPGQLYGTTPTSAGRPYPNIDLDVIY